MTLKLKKGDEIGALNNVMFVDKDRRFIYMIMHHETKSVMELVGAFRRFQHDSLPHYDDKNFYHCCWTVEYEGETLVLGMEKHVLSFESDDESGKDFDHMYKQMYHAVLDRQLEFHILQYVDNI